jgi:hypothetical protein
MSHLSRLTGHVPPATILALALVAFTVATSAAASDMPGAGSPRVCSTGWTIVASPSPGDGGNTLIDVQALSASEAWSVGSQISTPGGSFVLRPLAQHWDGTRWSEVPTAGTFTGKFNGLQAFSPANVWAVGWKTRDVLDSVPLVEHYDGTAWKVVKSPQTQEANLFDVKGLKSTDLWAVGTMRGITPGMLIEHFDGRAWTVQQTPVISSAFVLLSALAPLSPTDVWAAGYSLGDDGLNKPLVVHYDGSSWQIVATPLPEGNDASLSDIFAVNSSNVWVVGRSKGSTRYRTFAMQRVGDGWRIVAAPSVGTGDNTLNGLTGNSDGKMWAVGSSADKKAPARTLIEYYTDGAWTISPSPNASDQDNVLMGVGGIPGTVTWAVGEYNPTTAGKSLVEQRCG